MTRLDLHPYEFLRGMSRFRADFDYTLDTRGNRF